MRFLKRVKKSFRAVAEVKICETSRILKNLFLLSRVHETERKKLKNFAMARSHCLVVKSENSLPRGPCRHHLLDGMLAKSIALKNEIKFAKLGITKKIKKPRDGVRVREESVGRGLVDELCDEDDGRQHAGNETHRPDHDV